MKRLLFLLSFVLLLGFTGCTPNTQTGGTPSVGIVSKDPVVDAEKLSQAADATFNALFTIEKENHDLMVKYAPTVHQAIDGLRVRSRLIQKDLRTFTKAYEANSTPGNLINLNAVLGTIQAALTEAATYQKQVQTVTAH